MTTALLRINRLDYRNVIPILLNHLLQNWTTVISTSRRTTRLLLVSLLTSSSLAMGSPVSVIDDTGTRITLPEPAKRIVSLSPHNTELLFAIGAGDKLVGVVDYSDYPEQAKSIANVGGYSKLNIERIVSLRPDLVVGWHSGNLARSLEKLKKLGLTLYLTEPEGLADIINSMRKLAILTDTQTSAQQAIDKFEGTINQLKQQNTNKQKIKVFYQVWEEPLYTLGGTHFSNEIFQLCQVENIFYDIKEKAPIVSVESIIQRNPDFIITGKRHGERSLEQWQNTWAKWTQMTAVKYQQLYFVDADIFTRSSPRAALAAERLCAIANNVRQTLYHEHKNQNRRKE